MTSETNEKTKPETAHPQPNNRLDYWWHKENYRRLTSEQPLSRINAARKIITAEQITQFKISTKKNVKATVVNYKKNLELSIELSFKAWGEATAKTICEMKDDYLNGIIALINGELTAEFYQNFSSTISEIFITPDIFTWQCSCQNSSEKDQPLCEHVLAVLLKLLEECKYMPMIYFQLRGFGLPEFKQLFFDLPVDDSGRAELPAFLKKDFYQQKPDKANLPKDWLDDYYGKPADFSEAVARELEPFREQRYYHHKFNRDFYDTLDALKREIAKFWHQN